MKKIFITLFLILIGIFIINSYPTIKPNKKILKYKGLMQGNI